MSTTSTTSTKPYLRRKKCGVILRELHERDLIMLNSPWDFFGDGPSGWCISIQKTSCKHSFEVVRGSQEGEVEEEVDTSFRDYFQCIHCKDRLKVQITFGCPRCSGRHIQFVGICGSRMLLCPQNPDVPFQRSEVFGIQFEVFYYAS